MEPGKIIFLNGTSSSGKSSLARELQRRLPEPFLHLQLDAFIEMLPRPLGVNGKPNASGYTPLRSQ